MIALPPIHFDRASGALEGANLWERTAALALATGSKISSHFSHGCEEHGNDPARTVSRYILEKTPLRLIVYDPRSNQMETVRPASAVGVVTIAGFRIGEQCTGTVVAPRIVLTAAHCLPNGMSQGMCTFSSG